MNTSANIDLNTFVDIGILSEKANISKSRIVAEMIFYIFDRIESDLVVARLIEYRQKSIMDCKKIDYYVNDILADIKAEIRFKYRISISLVISICYFLFWKEIVEIFLGKEKLPETFFHNYELIKKLYFKLINDSPA